MKFDKRWYIIPVFFLCILLWYPFYNGDSALTMDQMKEQIIPLVDSETYKQLDEKELKKYFGITIEEIEGFVGFKSKDNMSAETLLIIHLKQQEDADSIKEKINSYMENEHKKYDGYIVEQFGILNNYNMVDKKGYIFLSVMKEDQKYLSTFQNAL